ncbi:MAG: hypothetical protein K0A89_05625 [ANME-2 cluster archaeon]|nr:hypothetical protein [ANME-2 cluster archaeon]
MPTILRKNITISEDHFDMLDPILKKHNNNLSAAMRDIIEYAVFTLERYDSIERGKEMLEKMLEKEDSVYDVTIPISMFKWLITSRDGKIPSLEEVKQLFMSQMFTEKDINSLIRSINEQNKTMHWPLFIKCDVDKRKLYIIITGVDKAINKFEALLLSQYLATIEEPFVLEEMVVLPTSIQIQYEKGSREKANASMLKHFEVSSTISKEIVTH